MMEYTTVGVYFLVFITYLCQVCLAGEYCQGYFDWRKKWRNGFRCTKYCCGWTDEKWCCKNAWNRVANTYPGRIHPTSTQKPQIQKQIEEPFSGHDDDSVSLTVLYIVGGVLGGIIVILTVTLSAVSCYKKGHKDALARSNNEGAVRYSRRSDAVVLRPANTNSPTMDSGNSGVVYTISVDTHEESTERAPTAPPSYQPVPSYPPPGYQEFDNVLEPQTGPSAPSTPNVTVTHFQRYPRETNRPVELSPRLTLVR